MRVDSPKAAISALLPVLDRYGLVRTKSEVLSEKDCGEDIQACYILVRGLAKADGAIPDSVDAVRYVQELLASEGEDADWDAQLACRELLRRAGVPEDEITGSDE
ncbi:hypothetical protein [Pseudoscardovia suis]